MLKSMFAAVVVTDIIAVSLAFYLLPVIIACIRRVPDIGVVAVINVLLGWTLAGWVVALALALRSSRYVSPVLQVVQNLAHNRPSPVPPEPGSQPPESWAGPGAPAPRQDPPPLVLPRRPANPAESANPAERG
jgi:uncharacterized membrane protein